MRRALALLPLLAWANAAGAAFRPVEDRPYRYDTIETRTSGGVARRFHASRSVVFHRSADGFEAIVTLDSVAPHAEDEVARMFVAANAGLLHQPLRYRLDAAGAVVAVEDADRAIALIATAIEQASLRNRTRSGSLKTLASPLRTLPPERKAAMLRSILTPLLAGAAAERAPGRRTVMVAGRPPLPPGGALTGVETVSRGAGGVITVDTRAEGGMPPATPDTPGARIARPVLRPSALIHVVRNLDSASGLLRDSRETSDATIADGEAFQTSRIEIVISLTPPAR